MTPASSDHSREQWITYYADRSPSPCFGFTLSPRAFRFVGGKRNRAAARTRREHLAGNANAPRPPRIRIWRSRSDRCNLHARHCPEPASRWKATWVLRECCHSPRVARPRSWQGGGTRGIGTRVGGWLPPRADAERSSRSPRACLLRTAGFQAWTSGCLCRSATENAQRI